MTAKKENKMSQENTQQLFLDSPESPDSTQKIVIESPESPQQSLDAGEVAGPSHTSTQINSPENNDEKRFGQENIGTISNERFESPHKTRDEYINSFLEMCRDLEKQQHK